MRRGLDAPGFVSSRMSMERRVTYGSRFRHLVLDRHAGSPCSRQSTQLRARDRNPQSTAWCWIRQYKSTPRQESESLWAREPRDCSSATRTRLAVACLVTNSDLPRAALRRRRSGELVLSQRVRFGERQNDYNVAVELDTCGTRQIAWSFATDFVHSVIAGVGDSERV